MNARFILLLAGFGLMAAPSAFAAGLFGLIEIKADRIDSIPKWVDVLARTRAEGLYDTCAQGGCGGKRADWFQMLVRAREREGLRQVDFVNRWVNRYPYITDDELWRRSDYWATPGQFLDKSGDCEDYAIAKYYTLRRLGWPESALRLVVVHDSVRDIPHAVLSVTVEGQHYILDNLSTEPLLDRYVRQYTPYYAVNANSRWVFIKPLKQ